MEQVEITGVAAEGKALARVNDLVVFVPFAAPGDIVDLQLMRKKHNYAEARIVKFHAYSSLRVNPFCEHFGVCRKSYLQKVRPSNNIIETSSNSHFPISRG